MPTEWNSIVGKKITNIEVVYTCYRSGEIRISLDTENDDIDSIKFDIVAYGPDVEDLDIEGTIGKKGTEAKYLVSNPFGRTCNKKKRV